MVGAVTMTPRDGIIIRSLSAGTGTQVIAGGVNDYDKLINKPAIEGVVLQGDITLQQLGIEEDTPLTNTEIEQLINSVIL